jgi:hypothetical protein
VSQAILKVLAEAQSLRVRDIQAGVEQLLGEPVSRHSIKAYLHKDQERQTPRCVRVARGRYRLATS